MELFDLEILTPERVFYRGRCRSLIVPITDGMLGIMANRAPITASITGGAAHLAKPDGETILFSLSGGMIDVEHNRVKVLCDYALMPDEIDEQRQLQEMEAARLALEQKQSRRDSALAKLIFSEAVNNLRVRKSVNNS